MRTSALVLLDEVNLLPEGVLAQMASIIAHTQISNPKECSPGFQVRDIDPRSLKKPMFVSAMNPSNVGGGRAELPNWFEALCCTLHVDAPKDTLRAIVGSMLTSSKVSSSKDKESIGSAIETVMEVAEAFKSEVAEEFESTNLRSLQRLCRLYAWLVRNNEKDVETCLKKFLQNSLPRSIDGTICGLDTAVSWASVASPFILLQGPCCTGKSGAIARCAMSRGKQLLTLNAHADITTTDILGSFAVQDSAFETGDTVDIRSTDPNIDGKEGKVLCYEVETRTCTVLTDVGVKRIPFNDVKLGEKV
eukprot:Skav204119  [mRNA]  locus=scaffold5190:210439:211353:- [translate_table: standard]